MMPAFAYLRPKSLSAAISSLQGEDTYVLAGGSDLLGCLRDEIFTADKLVSLSGLKKELHGIAPTAEGGLSIGALTTLSEVAADERIRSRYPGLAQAASEVASPQLRNQGTLGGNLCQKPRCWYYRGDFHCLRKGGSRCFALGGEDQFHCILGGHSCYIIHPSDTAPMLAAFKALVHISGPDGERTMPVSRLHVSPSENPTRELSLSPGEIITSIYLPPVKETVRSSYRKIRTRRAWDFALAGVALVLDMDGPRVNSASVYLSGCAPIPWHAAEVEETISGRELNQRIMDQAAQRAVNQARPLSKNQYKVQLVKGVVREELSNL
ncbi:MAG: FAD binding domain-containing protein [Desulfovermiculus sp.]